VHDRVPDVSIAEISTPGDLLVLKTSGTREISVPRHEYSDYYKCTRFYIFFFIGFVFKNADRDLPCKLKKGLRTRAGTRLPWTTLYTRRAPEPGRSMSNRKAPLSLTIRSCSANSSCSPRDPSWDAGGAENYKSLSKACLEDARCARLYGSFIIPLV